MGARRTMEIAAPPEATRKLSAAIRSRILRLYDVPATVRQIAEETQLPMTVVRRALQEMVPADGNRWLEL